MPCIKIVDKPYENYTDTYHLIHKYIFPKSKYIGGLAVDPVYAAEQWISADIYGVRIQE